MDSITEGRKYKNTSEFEIYNAFEQLTFTEAKQTSFTAAYSVTSVGRCSYSVDTRVFACFSYYSVVRLTHTLLCTASKTEGLVLHVFGWSLMFFIAI